MKNEFLVFGASGLTGGYFLKEITGFVGRAQEVTVLQKEVDELKKIVKQQAQLITELQESHFSDSAFNAVKEKVERRSNSVIIKKAEKAHSKKNYKISVELAKKAYKNNIQNILVISAVGANKSSPNFYLKTKGVMEEEIRKIGFNTIIFARPGHLLGPRDISRVDVFVRLIEFFGNIFSFMYVGPLRKYKNISAKTVANVLLRSLEQEQSISEIISYERV